MLFDPKGTKWVLYGTLLIWAMAFFVIGFRTAHDKPVSDGTDLQHDKRDVEPNIDTEEDDDEEEDGEADHDEHDDDEEDDKDLEDDDFEEHNGRHTTNERRKKSNAKLHKKNKRAKSSASM